MDTTIILNNRTKYIIETFAPFLLLFGCFIYYKFKFFGFIISLIALLITPLLYNEYRKIGFRIKYLLVILFSNILFFKINFNSKYNINNISSLFLFLNVFCLIFTSFDNKFYQNPINNYSITALLLLLSFCTPYFNIINKTVNLKKGLITPDAYVIFYTVFLTYYKFINKDFNEHKILTISSLWISLIAHFSMNKWIEYRVLTLSLIGLFDLIDIKNYGY